MVDEETPTTTQDQQDKQVTVAVPEERVAEFYAFYSRFLAGPRGRRGRGPGRHGHGHGCGHGHGHGHGCGEHHAPAEPEATQV